MHALTFFVCVRPYLFNLFSFLVKLTKTANAEKGCHRQSLLPSPTTAAVIITQGKNFQNPAGPVLVEGMRLHAFPYEPLPSRFLESLFEGFRFRAVRAKSSGFRTYG